LRISAVVFCASEKFRAGSYIRGPERSLEASTTARTRRMESQEVLKKLLRVFP
jgi:hypothetical protein